MGFFLGPESLVCILGQYFGTLAKQADILFLANKYFGQTFISSFESCHLPKLLSLPTSVSECVHNTKGI